MPTYEVICKQGQCPEYGEVKDTFVKTFSSPLPACPFCGIRMEKVMFTPPAAIWTKPYGEYGVKGMEGYSDKGITVQRTMADGSKAPAYLETVQEVREYCRSEGFRMPDEINPNATVKKDGRGMNTSGEKGQWTWARPNSDDGKPHCDGWV